jgi:hypothetical protein
LPKISEKKSSSRRDYTLNIQKYRNQADELINLDNIELEKQLGLGSKHFTKYKKIIDAEISNSEKQDDTYYLELNKVWKNYFSQIYHDTSLELDLFIRHSYLILICNCTKRLLDNLIHSFNNEPRDISIVITSLEYLNHNFFPFLDESEKIDNTMSSTLSELESEISTVIANFLKPSPNLIDSQDPISHEMNLKNAFIEIINEKGDLFNLLYQDMILPTQRHKMGEFFTPIPLASLIIKEIYHSGDKAIDPACGTATFLIEIIKVIFTDYITQEKINPSSIQVICRYINQLTGIELNPLTSSVAVLNVFSLILPLFLYLKHNNLIDLSMIPHDFLNDLPRIIVNNDFLITEKEIESTSSPWEARKYDLIIGNPPWLVINGVYSKDYKEKMKELARNYGINTNKQNTSNLEISSLFITKGVQNLLKNNGRLGLVLSAGILTGSQNDRLREFKGLKEVYFWRFDKDIFNIHNICMFATKGSEEPQKKYKIPIETKICTDNPISINPGLKEIYEPQYYRLNDVELNVEDLVPDELNKILFGRLIPENEKKEHSASISSVYHDLFRQGACLGPRNLIFCQELSLLDKDTMKKVMLQGIDLLNEQNNIIIRPDPEIGYKAYSNWDFRAYQYATIKPHQIYEVAKTTDLIPFLLLKTTQIFLPVNLWKLVEKNITGKSVTSKTLIDSFITDKLLIDKSVINKNIGKSDILRVEKQFETDAHYNFLNSIYKEKLKTGGSIDTLFKNMNHNNKMLNYHQLKTFKIVYNGIGSILKAALIKGDILIDSSIYYFTPKNDNEAYYLLGIFNSPMMTKLISQMGSTGSGGSLRNIHKNPLNIAIPEFVDNDISLQIIQLSKEIEFYVANWIVKYIQNILSKYGKEKAICPYCSKIVEHDRLNVHLETCSQSEKSDFLLYAFIFNSLTQKELQELSTTDILMSILIGKKYIEKKSGPEERHIKASSEGLIEATSKIIRFTAVIQGLLKPKTIQKALFNDPQYLSQLESLNATVKQLIGYESK